MRWRVCIIAIVFLATPQLAARSETKQQQLDTDIFALMSGEVRHA